MLEGIVPPLFEGATLMNRLFATTVTNARPRERDYKLTDGEGLFLLVRPNGSKLCRMNYKYLGRYRTLSFGAWPEVSLADARVKRDEARRQVAADHDPSHERKLERGSRFRRFAVRRDDLTTIAPSAHARPNGWLDYRPREQDRDRSARVRVRSRRDATSQIH